MIGHLFRSAKRAFGRQGLSFCAVAVLAISLSLPNTSTAREVAYVVTHSVDTLGDKLIAYDIDDLSVIAEIEVDDVLRGVAASADGERVYVLQESSLTGGNVLVFDATSVELPLLASVNLGWEGWQWQDTKIFMAPDDTRVYVAGFTTNQVFVIDAATYEVEEIDLLPWGGLPIGLDFTPDGARAYVADHLGEVLVLDTDPGSPTTYNTVIDTVTEGDGRLPSRPVGVAVTPDGSRAYIGGYYNTPNVSVVDTDTNTVIDDINRPKFYAEARFLAASPDGRHVYVPYGMDSIETPNLLSIDTSSNEFDAELSLRGRQHKVEFTADGKQLVSVALTEPSGISVVDTDPTSPTYHEVTDYSELEPSLAYGPAVAPFVFQDAEPPDSGDDPGDDEDSGDGGDQDEGGNTIPPSFQKPSPGPTAAPSACQPRYEPGVSVSHWVVAADHQRLRIEVRPGGSMDRSGRSMVMLKRRGTSGRAAVRYQKVEFILDGRLLKTDTKVPYSVRVSSKEEKAGYRNLEVIATSRSGRRTTLNLPIYISDCVEEAFSVSSSTKVPGASINTLSLRLGRGSDPFNKVEFTLASLLRFRPVRNTTIGTVLLIADDGKVTKKTLKYAEKGQTLFSGSGMRVALAKGRARKFVVRGIPDRTRTLEVRLKGRGRTLRNSRSGCGRRLSFTAAATFTSGETRMYKRSLKHCKGVG